MFELGDLAGCSQSHVCREAEQRQRHRESPTDIEKGDITTWGLQMLAARG